MCCVSCPPPLPTHKGHAWRPLIFSMTEASGTARVSIPELRGSGSVTQGNTLQDSSVYSNVQKSIHAARSPLIGAPAPSSAQAPWVFHRTDTISLQGVHTEHKGLPSCGDPGADLRPPCGAQAEASCGPGGHSPPASPLRTGPCFSFTVRAWLGSTRAQNPSIHFVSVTRFPFPATSVRFTGGGPGSMGWKRNFPGFSPLGNSNSDWSGFEVYPDPHPVPP